MSKVYGRVSDIMRTGKISAKGQITDLSQNFKLKNGIPFSLYLRPKTAIDEADRIIHCRLYQESETSPVPVGFSDWQPLAIMELAADTALLDECDVFWGAGEEAIP
ncbi:hypothetical protein EZS27_034606 [termite gut metagenome]|uniref:Uncharacterized protein n=1 Tax=termite gut metagenome TaxID=433724 RepID=A0A5J4PZ56_9ZZZZ